MNLRKFLVGATASVVMLGAMITTAFAATPNWDITGTWKLDFALGEGHYLHTMIVTAFDKNTGAFSGTGTYDPDNSYTWTVTGTVSGNDIVYDMVYTGTNAGYTNHVIGFITSATTMDGTWKDSAGQEGSWTGVGNAKPVLTTPTDKDQCKKGGWKTFNNPTFKNQGECLAFVEHLKDRMCKDGKRFVETVEVPASQSINTTTVFSLLQGTKYTFKVSGDWENRNDSTQRADAEYATMDSWGTWMDGYDITPYFLGAGEFDLQINEKFVDWGNYSSKHTYKYDYIGEGTPVNFRIFDGDSNIPTLEPTWYGDNSGSLKVDIYSLCKDNKGRREEYNHNIKYDNDGKRFYDNDGHHNDGHDKPNR